MVKTSRRPASANDLNKHIPKKKTKKWMRLNEVTSDTELEFIGTHQLEKVETVGTKSPVKRPMPDLKIEKSEEKLYQQFWQASEEERKRVGYLEIDNHMLLKISRECCTCSAKEIVEKVVLKK